MHKIGVVKLVLSCPSNKEMGILPSAIGPKAVNPESTKSV
jgi:hypothetical protein